MISIVCPVYNEEQYIDDLLHFCITAQPAEKEIILVDGNSTDATCSIIQQYCNKHTNIKLLHNPHRYVPYALNMALKAASGNIIIRLDAHTQYAPDYFEQILQTFDKTSAHIVGGPMRIAQGTIVQNAVGYVTATHFGVGNSSFHFEMFEGVTNSVYLGAWKKEIFTATGLFDEAFVRNQDDEFNYRAKKLGFTIYQSPSIKVYYYPRKTFKALFSQYYQYGYYKPMVLHKIKSAIRPSYFIPSLLVLYIMLTPVAAYITGYTALLPVALYLLCCIGFAAIAKKPIQQTLLICCAYFVIHTAYGYGFLAGFLKPLQYQHTKVQVA